MSLTASGSNEERVLAPQGTHLARCVQVIDLGTQQPHPNSQYQKSRHRVLIGWELCNELNPSNEPILVWKEYTVSLAESSHLYPDLISWRGRAFTEKELEGFDLKTIVGAPCQLQIIHERGKGNNSNKIYSSIQSVTAVMKQLKDSIPPQAHGTIIYDVHNHDPKIWETFSDFLKEKIMNCAEWKTLHSNSGMEQANKALAESAAEEDGSDYIPF